jgi:hypothetical protein
MGDDAAGDDVLEAFLAAAPEDRRPVLERVDEVIRTAAPGLERALWDGTLGYGRFHYRYATGREGDSFVVGLADRRRYVSVYVMAVEDGVYAAEAAAGRLGEVSVGRSCIRFKRIEDVELDVLAELVRKAAALHGEGSSA